MVMSNEELAKRLFSLEDRVKRLEERNAPFKVPSQLEVNDYFALKDSTLQEANKFFNYYQSKNWMVGKSKMKDWKAAARNWLSKQEPKKSTIFDL